MSQPRSEVTLAASHAPVIFLEPFYLWLLLPSAYTQVAPIQNCCRISCLCGGGNEGSGWTGAELQAARGWSVAEAELGLGPAQALSRSCGSLPTCPFLIAKSEC